MNRFKLLRYEKGLTIMELAEGSGVSRPTLYGLEQPGGELPSAPIAKKLADFYGLTILELLGVDEPNGDGGHASAEAAA